MISPNSMTNRPPVEEQKLEQQLGDILQLLNPPLIELANKLGSFLDIPNLPSTERILATYFELFAHGFNLWDITYYINKVHEYYYAGYLQAKQVAGENPEFQLLEMLEKFTRAMIAFTQCENAMLCNDPKDLLNASTDAVTYMEKALEFLAQSSLEKRKLLREPIEKYFNSYLQNFRGLKLCANMFLAALKREDIPISKQSEINQLLSFLDITSPEIASILRAHAIFAQRFSQAQAQRSTDLRVKEGKLLLLALGYVGEELVKALFDKCKGNKIPKEVEDAARKKSHLPVSVHGSYMQDIFDTILGGEYLQSVIFELPTRDSKLTFLIHDGEEDILVKEFQVSLTHFGIISVEFGFSLKDASVSHVRVLESLISPHAGRFDIVWQGAPSDIGRGATNSVDYYLKSQKWVDRIQSVMQGEESSASADSAVHREEHSTLTEMESVLEKWQQALGELATLLPRQYTGPSNEPSEETEPSEGDAKAVKKKAEASNESSKQAERLESVYQTLHQECFLRMCELAQQWMQESSMSSSLEEIVQAGKRLFPPGVRFERLMDIAQEVLKRIGRFLHSNLSEEHHTASSEVQTEPNYDFRRALRFDPSIGWSAILSCNRLTLVEPDKREIELTTEWDQQRVFAHPEFKGFIIQSREARASLYDWLFVKIPPYRNLATIRSHETDMMCITENRAFLYLPDEPEYLVKQYIETARLLNDLRILVLSFNTIAKEQIKDLESFFDQIQRTEKDRISGKNLSKSYSLLLSRRNQIEIFRIHAEKILDLLRSCTISKYQDHSDLIKEMIKESRVNEIRDSLEHNIMNLDRFHAYLTERLRRRMDDRTQTTQRWIGYMVAFITFLSVLTVISIIRTDLIVLYAFLVRVLVGIIGLAELLGGTIGGIILLLFTAVLLVGVVLGSIVVSLKVWQRSRKT